MIVGRDEQSTERALVAAQAEWLRARGWVADGLRWRHHAALTREAVTAHVAEVQTRMEPLRYRKAR